MYMAGMDCLRKLIDYAKVNELQSYLQSEKVLLRFARLVEERKLDQWTVRDLQLLMQELGYDVTHYLKTLHDWSSRYEAVARPWDAVRQEDQPHPMIRRYAQAGFASTGRLLEIGCGSGANARFLSSRGASVTAIDVARPAIENSQARALREGSSCKFVCSNIFEFETPPASFDAVLDCWCFHHIPIHLTPVFAERVARALKPRGEFLLLCHSPHSTPPLALTLGLTGALAKVIAYLVDATCESVPSREELREIYSPHFDIGAIELYHDAHVRFKGHYSYVTHMRKKA